MTDINRYRWIDWLSPVIFQRRKGGPFSCCGCQHLKRNYSFEATCSSVGIIGHVQAEIGWKVKYLGDSRITVLCFLGGTLESCHHTWLKFEFFALTVGE